MHAKNQAALSAVHAKAAQDICFYFDEKANELREVVNELVARNTQIAGHASVTTMEWKERHDKNVLGILVHENVKSPSDFLLKPFLIKLTVSETPKLLFFGDKVRKASYQVGPSEDFSIPLDELGDGYWIGGAFQHHCKERTDLQGVADRMLAWMNWSPRRVVAYAQGNPAL